MSVTPDIGARITGLSRLIGPICNDMCVGYCFLAYLLGNFTRISMVLKDKSA